MTYVFKLLKDAFKVNSSVKDFVYDLHHSCFPRIGNHDYSTWCKCEILNNLQDVSFLNMLSLALRECYEELLGFRLGVSPYITASIVVQLLQMDLLPKFVEWGKQGGLVEKAQPSSTYLLGSSFRSSIGVTATLPHLVSGEVVATLIPRPIC